MSNSVSMVGRIHTCVEMEDAIGCWGWIELDEHTAIGYKILGNPGRNLLNISKVGQRVVFFGELHGKPVEIIVNSWILC